MLNYTVFRGSLVSEVVFENYSKFKKEAKLRSEARININADTEIDSKKCGQNLKKTYDAGEEKNKITA